MTRGLLQEVHRRELWPQFMRHLKALPISLEDEPALLRLADRLEPSLRKAFLAAVAQIQNRMDLEALAAAIEANQLTMAEAAAGIGKFPEDFGELAIPLRAGFIAGAGVAIHELGRSGLSLSFDLVNPHAVSYAAQAAIDIVQPFKDGAKDVIREFIGRALQGEMTYKEAAGDIRDLIGLDPQRVARADNFWQQLMEDGISDADIERRVGRYMDSLLRERAEVIARHQIHRAAGAGQATAWREADRTGLINADEWVRMWIVTWDEVLCPMCEAMDGVTTGLHDAYDQDIDGNPVQNVFGDTMDVPDMHPNCRCTENLVKADEAENYRDRMDAARPDEKPVSRNTED